jgi:hypothetical protein
VQTRELLDQGQPGFEGLRARCFQRSELRLPHHLQHSSLRLKNLRTCSISCRAAGCRSALRRGAARRGAGRPATTVPCSLATVRPLSQRPPGAGLGSPEDGGPSQGTEQRERRHQPVPRCRRGATGRAMRGLQLSNATRVRGAFRRTTYPACSQTDRWLGLRQPWLDREPRERQCPVPIAP